LSPADWAERTALSMAASRDSIDGGSAPAAALNNSNDNNRNSGRFIDSSAAGRA
jgi:hypothetical protein